MGLRAEFLDQVRNVHLEHLREVISPAPLNPDEEMEFLFLCFTNRCGSNFIADLLASTDEFNLAGEFFNFDTVLAHISNKGFRSFDEYFRYLCLKVAKKQRLTCKLAVTHLALLHEAGILDQIVHRSKFVVIERIDRLGQAISLAIAAQTGQWTSYMPSRISEDELRFSPVQIEGIIKNILQEQHLLELFFAVNGIDNYVLLYEQFVREPEVCVAALMRWLGSREVRFDLNKVRVAQQASPVNSRWRQLFLKEAQR